MKSFISLFAMCVVMSRLKSVAPHLSVTHDLGVTLTSGATPKLNEIDVKGITMINLILQSAFIEKFDGESYNPLSLLIIGKPSSGKSRLLLSLRKYPFVSYTDDITPKYLIEFLKKAEVGQKRFLVIPDFQVVTHSHGRKTQSTTISILRQMLSDGVSNLDDLGLEFHPKFPVKAGLITATTLSSYSEFSVAWKKDGFLSRLIPFSFEHSPTTLRNIESEIINNNCISLSNIKYQIYHNPPKVVTDDCLLLQLKGYAEQIGERLNAYPYRALKQLISLVKMIVLIKDESVLTQEHIDILLDLLTYLNYDFNSI
jgi:hypothetical protein